jgi:hypothetical protein
MASQWGRQLHHDRLLTVSKVGLRDTARLRPPKSAALLDLPFYRDRAYHYKTRAAARTAGFPLGEPLRQSLAADEDRR